MLIVQTPRAAAAFMVDFAESFGLDPTERLRDQPNTASYGQLFYELI